jgi:ribosomal protein S27AE
MLMYLVWEISHWIASSALRFTAQPALQLLHGPPHLLGDLAETARLMRRVTKRLRNLCAYEGAEYKPLRASGKLCPRCGAMGVEVAHRVYRCPRCGLEWNRDRCATFMLALEYAKITGNEALHKALLEWLEEHPRALLS